MVLGTGSLAVCAIMYQGVKEAWRFTYVAPALPKGLRGNSGWEEVRFRHPSPGSVFVTPFHARALKRDHFKTSYMTSRYYVRNQWDEEFQRGTVHCGTHAPDLAKLSAVDQAKLLGYIEGDAKGNAKKKVDYEEFYQKSSGEELTGWLSKMRETLKANPDLHHDFYGSANLEERQSDVWEDEDDFEPPKNLPALPLEKQYRMEYWLVWWTSFELQLQLEFDYFIERTRDCMKKDGINVYQGSRYNWQVGGGNLPEAEINKLNSWLKLRHAANPQP